MLITKKAIIYVPLDERSCNYEYPNQMGTIAGLEIRRPPIEWLSKRKQTARVDQLWQWLYENAPDASYAVISLDMLIYGGLLPSRVHRLAEKECLDRLNRLKKLRKICPQLEIHAFNLIMRTSSCNSSNEEPDYWVCWGERIWQYGCLNDKKNRSVLAPGEQRELKQLTAAIPKKYLADYTRRRKINLNVRVILSKTLLNNILAYFHAIYQSWFLPKNLPI